MSDRGNVRRRTFSQDLSSGKCPDTNFHRLSQSHCYFVSIDVPRSDWCVRGDEEPAFKDGFLNDVKLNHNNKDSNNKY